MNDSTYDHEPKISTWKERVTRSGCTIRSMEPLETVHKKNGELLFGMFKTDIIDPHGKPLPPIVLIRGDACVVVPLITNQKTGEQRYVMVLQRRIGTGNLALEFPAGMLDRHVGDPRDVAARELHEETGLQVSPKDFFPLAKKPLFTSAGLQDEGIHYFGCLLTLPDPEYRRLEGRATGNPEEEEHINVTLKTYEEGVRETDSAQVRLAFVLFDSCRKKQV